MIGLVDLGVVGIEPDDAAYLRGMERLVEAVRSLASARNLDEIAEVVRSAARELSAADGATFVLRESGSCHYLDEDAIAPLWRGRRFPIDTCISGWAMLHKQSVAISDIYADPRIPHDAYRPTFVKSLTISPIRTAEPVGAIGTYWATHHEATVTECRLLQALADTTAVAMESVRVLGELEARVAERTAQLAIANGDLEMFAVAAAHDLRSPVSTMAMYAQLLEAEVGDDGGLVGNAARVINRSCGRSLAMIDELLAFARAGSSALVARPVDLDELVRSTLVEVESTVRERGARVTVGQLGRVSGDEALLRQALQNLVLNALTYVSDAQAPQVRIDVVRSPRSVEVRVGDNGPGVRSEERERILEPFERGSASAGRSGTGLGLAICRRVAEHHGGQLCMRDAPEGGAEFVLVLPLDGAASVSA